MCAVAPQSQHFVLVMGAAYGRRARQKGPALALRDDWWRAGVRHAAPPPTVVEPPLHLRSSPALLPRVSRQSGDLENYLLDSAGIVAAVSLSSRQGSELPVQEEIASVIDEAADGLRRKVVVNRVCSQIGPAQPLVARKLRQELAAADADMSQIKAKIVERMMTADRLRAQIAELASLKLESPVRAAPCVRTVVAMASLT
jgi:hypothetical protein